jgi:hypothetical protein
MSKGRQRPAAIAVGAMLVIAAVASIAPAASPSSISVGPRKTRAT